MIFLVSTFLFENCLCANASTGAMVFKLNITDFDLIKEVITLTGASLLEPIAELPGIKGNELAYETIVDAGQIAFAEAYKWVYYVSIVFGGVSIIAACFLGDIRKYMGKFSLLVSYYRDRHCEIGADCE